jgi:cell division protein FtsZ
MEDFEIDIVETKCQTTGAKIKAIGVGGGGGNMINYMISQGIYNIDLIVANTDAQALETSLAPYKLQLGLHATRGLGAGMVPEKGREAALESYDDLKEMLEGADIVFISAGLGGGTGTGAAPIIAQAAKEVGALTVAIVTSPFKFEGRKRSKLAKAGLEELKQESDSIIVVPNEKLLSIVEKNLGIKESFKMVDDILAQAVGGISKVILSHGENDINLDFADVKTVMAHRGLALMGTGYSTGSTAAYDAAKIAIESPLLDNVSIDGAMGVLVQFDINPEYPLNGISAAMDIIYDSADENADVIFGTTTNENIAIDEVKITIVATGFEDQTSLSESIKTPIPPVEKTPPKPEPKQEEPRQNNSVHNSINTATINMNKIRSKMASNGYNSDNDDILDVPTFLRKHMD